MSPGQGDNERPLVLVVDDIRSARIGAEEVLGVAGYEVITVADAVGASHALASTKEFRAIVADWVLAPHAKGGDGISLLELVGLWYPSVARVLWTAYPGGCDVAARLGIPCVEKSDDHRLTVLVATLRLLLRPQGDLA